MRGASNECLKLPPAVKTYLLPFVEMERPAWSRTHSINFPYASFYGADGYAVDFDQQPG